MRYSKTIYVERAVSNDILRPALNYVYFDGEYLVATDGHILIATANIQFDPDESKEPFFITAETIAYARKLSSKSFPYIEIKSKGNYIECKNGVMFPKPVPENDFPNWKNVVPNEENTVAFFNPDIFVRGAKSLGLSMYNTVEMTKAVKNEGMYVMRDKESHSDNDKTFAILMGKRG